MKPLPHCERCGLCCLAAKGDTTYVQLLAEDSNIPASMVDRGAMKTRATRGYPRCVALSGDTSRSVSCTIYADRPAICREFERGGPDCIETIEFFSRKGQR